MSEINAPKAISNRYDFIVLFDVKWGNPNGNPDAMNQPRMDPQTMRGLVSDVCIKRKIRNYVEMVKEDSTGFRTYIKENSVLRNQDTTAFEGCGITPDTVKKDKDNAEMYDKKIREWMCENFYDIRTFGAVMTTYNQAPFNCGQIKGPVQIGFSESIEPINTQSVTITRMARTTEDEDKQNKQMGNKWVVPYGLYRCEGHISASLAKKTGFTEDDLELLWDAIYNMLENDRSASHGEMVMRKLIIFKHDCEHGNAPAHKLSELVTVKRKDGVSQTPARSYSDYEVNIVEDKLPEGVSLEVRE